MSDDDAPAGAIDHGFGRCERCGERAVEAADG
jgi:hypothetical protein